MFHGCFDTDVFIKRDVSSAWTTFTLLSVKGILSSIKENKSKVTYYLYASTKNQPLPNFQAFPRYLYIYQNHIKFLGCFNCHLNKIFHSICRKYLVQPFPNPNEVKHIFINIDRLVKTYISLNVRTHARMYELTIDHCLF